MFNKLISQIIASALGIFLAVHFVSGTSLSIVPGQSEIFDIPITKTWQMFLVIGLTLGLLNLFVKPILGIITLPIKILTLGFFSLVINMAMIWILDIVFLELIINGLISLFWTTMVVWGVNLFMGTYK